MPTQAPTELEALTQFLYLAPIGLVQAAADGEIMMINPMSAQLLLPLSHDGELANLFDVLRDVAPDLRHRAATYPSAQGLVCDSVHLPIRAGAAGHADAQVLSLSLLKLDSNRLMAVINDVSVSVQRDRALRQSQSWIETILAGISDYALMSLDRSGAVHGWNESVGRVTGFDAENIVGRSYASFCAGDPPLAQRALDRLADARLAGWSLDEGWRLRADGSRYWGSCLIAPLALQGEPKAGEPAYSLIIRDVSDRRQATDALRRSVACDELTGLANRSAFFDAAEFELARWLRAPGPVSLVLIEVDDFAALNSAHPAHCHTAGDAVLRHLAVSLSASFLDVGVLARIGGARFAALLPATGLEAACDVANRLCAAVAQRSAEVEGVAIGYGVSAGIAAMAPEVESLDTLLARAGSALQAAQAGGGHRAECWAGDLDRAAAPALTACEGSTP